MKAKEYKKIFLSDTWSKDLNDKFHASFTTDFKTTVELSLNLVKDGQLSLSAMNNLISQADQKFKSIRIQVPLVPESYWKFFYATVAAPLKTKLCAKDIKDLNERKRRKQEFNTYTENMFRSIFEDYFDNIISTFRNVTVPTASFDILQLAVTSNIDEINKQYKSLVKLHHPDFGGDTSSFILLTDAKNQCLSWAKQIS